MKHILNYNAPPSAEKFREVDEAELAEIIRQLRAALDRTPMGMAGDDDDLGVACRAAELMDTERLMILVAEDEDGYYFALGENERYRDWAAEERYRLECEAAQ